MNERELIIVDIAARLLPTPLQQDGDPMRSPVSESLRMASLLVER